ncbi:Clr6 histone deacetylase associated PHD protein-1 Cph1 [Schizosaccharomyces pombe]
MASSINNSSQPTVPSISNNSHGDSFVNEGPPSNFKNNSLTSSTHSSTDHVNVLPISQEKEMDISSPAKKQKASYSNKSPNKAPIQKSRGSSLKSHLETESQQTPVKRRRRKATIRNVDYCSACGGRGLFICCEGCPCSFHLSCLDPPLTPENIPEGSWFCVTCSIKSHHPPKHPLSIWSQLYDWIDSQNPSQYRLPDDLVHYFHGISRGDTGAYKETEGEMDTDEFSALPTGSSITNLAYCGYCSKPSMGACWVYGCQLCDTFYHKNCKEHAKKCSHDSIGKKGMRVPKNAVVIRTPLELDTTSNTVNPKDMISGWQFLMRELPSDELFYFPRLPVSCLYKVSEDGLIKDFLYAIGIEAKKFNNERKKRELEVIPPDVKSALLPARTHPNLPIALRTLFNKART